MRINLQKLLTLTLTLALYLTAIAQGQPRAKSQPQSFDIIIKGGTVYDGTGHPPVKADIGIKGDRIAAIGNLSRAATIRQYVIGLEDKPPTSAQLDQMRELVRREMEAGALGITTALIYPPAFFAKTEELIELCKVAAKYQGKYTTHMRSEGNQLIEGVQETMRIGREAGLPVEIYHLKASGEANWPKMDQLIRILDDARRHGLV